VCIALPGKLIEVDENGFVGKVDFQGNIVSVTLGAVDAEPGDFLLVHAGTAIEVMQQDAAEELMSLLIEVGVAFEDELEKGEDERERELLYQLFKGDAQA
jgi:hydrogenase expression/formation protein HypC